MRTGPVAVEAPGRGPQGGKAWMPMTQLRLFCPDGNALAADGLGESQPVVYSIAAYRIPVPLLPRRTAVTRARLIHANRTCRGCGRTTVVPREFRDAALNRNLAPVPGTATLAGFSCHSCGHEWSVGEGPLGG